MKIFNLNIFVIFFKNLIKKTLKKFKIGNNFEKVLYY